MSRIVLIQPDSGGRLSGGYLYNAQMAEHGVWDLCSAHPNELARIVDSCEADLIIADSIWLTPEAFAPFAMRVTRGAQMAVMLHSFPSMIAAAEGRKAPLSQPTAFELHALNQVSHVLVPGTHYQSVLTNRVRSLHVFAPGIADAWRTPPRPRSGPCQLVAVGAVTPRKGFLDLLRALRAMPHAGPWHLTIAGSLTVDPGYAREVAELAAQLGSVTLLGQQSPEQVRSQVTRADVLIMPSYDENQPLVVLEALAASVPTVAYAVGAVSHMIRHGRDGLVSAIGDLDALAQHLTQLMTDEPRRRAMAQSCWERQAELPSWSSTAEHARDALERMILAP